MPRQVECNARFLKAEKESPQEIAMILSTISINGPFFAAGLKKCIMRQSLLVNEICLATRLPNELTTERKSQGFNIYKFRRLIDL